MTTLYLLNYNNYYNRIVKSTTLANYKSQALYTLKDVSFKINDSCYTDQIVNISESVNPDYAVVTETANNVETISSRWFILESKRTRAGQYNLRLRRDVFVDYNLIVSNATLYCEKGWVNDDDPLIFNSEGNTYNQIKTQEQLLKDETGSAWIVGYCDNNLMQAAVGNKIDLTLYNQTPAWSAAYTTINDALAAFPNSSTENSISIFSGKVESPTISFITSLKPEDPEEDVTVYKIYYSPGACSIKRSSGTVKMHCKNPGVLYHALAVAAPSVDNFIAPIIDDKNIDTEKYNNLLSANKTIIRVGTGDPGDPYKYYQLNVQSYNYNILAQDQDIGDSYDSTCAFAFQKIYRAMSENDLYYDGEEYTDPSIDISYILTQYTAVWNDITDSTTVSISDNVPMSSTSPYYMFCMPYHSVTFNDENGTQRTSNPSYTMQFVRQLIETVGTHVIDVQLLPYFPDRYFQNAGVILGDEIDPDSITWVYDANNKPVSFVYWGAPQNFMFEMEYTISTLPNLKIDNETRFCRLSAPNYSASFDFSIAKNNGVDGFRIYCTYRPYQPHVQIMPQWGGVYGEMFNDARGLICGGDYSVDIVNDQWTEYQVMNKNYQLIFDRQIQSMDLQHDVQKINNIFGAASGTLSGAASGAMMGSSLGPVGMGVGAAIGGIVSGIGGILDVTNQQKLRTDQRSAAFDMFNYNLGNIQARPTTITKLSALAGNNKIWPFYEIYESTAREVAVLQSQLEYSSMTVNAIGIVSQFVSGGPTFVRGRLIRITGLEHDAEMSQLVADELARGIYMDIQIS